MKTRAMPLFFSACILIISCEKHAATHSKVIPAKVEKSNQAEIPAKVILTKEARSRLGIESQAYPKDSLGKQAIPLSSLLYDTKGNSWVFVETNPTEFHREQIRVLETQNNQIYIKSTFEDSLPIVSKGAAELIGTESGVGK